MTVLSDTEILNRLDNGQVVMFPETRANIRGSSVDLTLGRYFWRCRNDLSGGVLNPFSKESVSRYFAGPHRLKDYAAVYRKIGAPLYHGLLPEPSPGLFEGIPDDWPVLVLRPRERVLAHTHEFFGTHPPGTCEMRARSTWGRLGIAVCLCAGWGDPGYINRWTMEIHNTNDCHVVIPYGERICQMVLHESFESREHYGSEHIHYLSKYQHYEDLETVRKVWDPSDMIPRAWRDKRIMPEEEED